MRVVHTQTELIEALKILTHIAFVPTMGNLHEGHLKLIEEALKKSGVSDAGSSDEARHLAEDPDYDASNDSAFFDRNQ